MNGEIINSRLMGPDCTVILNELLSSENREEKIRILDLGCGKGLTSLFLAEKYGNAQIFAVDLWVDAADNFIFFKENNIDKRVIPLNCSAENMPFAEKYFDMIISIDSYHYFGTGKNFFKENIKPLLKENGKIFIAVPGLKDDYENIQKDLEYHISQDDFQFLKNINYWKDLFEKNLKKLEIHEMECFDEAWESWLNTENPYAIADRELLKADGGKYLNLIAINGHI